MANSKRSSPKSRWKKLRYFYLDGNLYKNLGIHLGQDTIKAWCYPTARRVVLTYSDVKARKGHAYTTPEMAKMLGKHPRHINRLISQGQIEPPQFTYGLDENRYKYKYLWSEKDIMRAHEYFLGVHIGRPRNDGMITNYQLPNARELRAMIRQEQVLYIKNEDGEFVPTWRAGDFT